MIRKLGKSPALAAPFDARQTNPPTGDVYAALATTISSPPETKTTTPSKVELVGSAALLLVVFYTLYLTA